MAAEQDFTLWGQKWENQEAAMEEIQSVGWMFWESANQSVAHWGTHQVFYSPWKYSTHTETYIHSPVPRSNTNHIHKNKHWYQKCWVMRGLTRRSWGSVWAGGASWWTDASAPAQVWSCERHPLPASSSGGPQTTICQWPHLSQTAGLSGNKSRGVQWSNDASGKGGSSVTELIIEWSYSLLTWRDTTYIHQIIQRFHNHWFWSLRSFTRGFWILLGGLP